MIQRMIETFLRRPHGPSEWTADAVRALGVLSIVIALIGWPLLDVSVFAAALLGLVVPRFLGVRPGLDIAMGVVVLVAAWSALLELYNAIAYWDVWVHFALNGLIAAHLYILAVRLGVVPDPLATRVRLAAIVALMTAFGLAAGVLWEMAEWAGHTFIDDSIFVGYDDTIGDLVAGGLGSLLAALAGRPLVARGRYVVERQDSHPSRV